MHSTHAIKTERRGPMPIMMHLALMALSQENMQHILQGIHNYHHHDFRREDELSPLESVWTGGASKLLHAPTKTPKQNHAPILLIPSFINGAEIFDLTQERSFMRWLAAQGYDVYLFDWGDLTSETTTPNLTTIITGKLVDALSFVTAQHNTPAHVLGYCLGGNLALALTSYAEKSVKSLTLLDTPWDFHHRDNALRRLLLDSDKNVRALAAKNGGLSTAYLQSLFIQTNIMQSAAKYANFGRNDPQSALAKHFVATEDWVNGGADIPAALIAECISIFYKDNASHTRQWALDNGHNILPSQINCPCMIITPKNDAIVPYATSHALKLHMPEATCISPDTGHIGMLVGRKAEQICWQPILSFLAQHEK